MHDYEKYLKERERQGVNAFVKRVKQQVGWAVPTKRLLSGGKYAGV